jgi:hypothetical protein
MSDIHIAIANGDDQSVRAVRDNKFDACIEINPGETAYTQKVTRIFCTWESRDLIKRALGTENSITYQGGLAVVIVEATPNEVESRLRRAFP